MRKGGKVECPLFTPDLRLKHSLPLKALKGDIQLFLPRTKRRHHLERNPNDTVIPKLIQEKQNVPFSPLLLTAREGQRHRAQGFAQVRFLRHARRYVLPAFQHAATLVGGFSVRLA